MGTTWGAWQSTVTGITHANFDPLPSKLRPVHAPTANPCRHVPLQCTQYIADDPEVLATRPRHHATIMAGIALAMVII